MVMEGRLPCWSSGNVSGLQGREGIVNGIGAPEEVEGVKSHGKLER